MRKICVFTQTYSDNREELYIYHNNDVTDIEFRNQFDLNIYSFHNCPDDYTERLKQYDYFKKITNLEFQSNNNIEYTHIIRNVLYDLLERGFDYFVYFQDDSLSSRKHIDTTELVKFIKEGEFGMMSLEESGWDLGVDKVYHESNGFIVHDTTTQDYYRRNEWAFDDGAFVANIRYLLDNFYDEGYLSIGCNQKGEKYLKDSIGPKNLQRLTNSIKLSTRYNIIGPNEIFWGKEYREILKNLYSDE
jgi:hypothetical protein